jgi:hypothetical protein
MSTTPEDETPSSASEATPSNAQELVADSPTSFPTSEITGEQPAVTTWDADRRKQTLAQAVANEVRGGWSVESQSDFQAVMVQPGTKVNHLLHLVLSLITLGIWLIVWALVTLMHKRTRHEVISVDEFGNMNIQR